MTDTDPQTDVITEFHREFARHGIRSGPLPPRDRSQLPGNLPGYSGPELGTQNRDLTAFTALSEAERVEQLRQASRDLTASARDLERLHYAERHAEAGEFSTDAGRTAILSEYRTQSEAVETAASGTYRSADRIIRAAERIAHLARQARDAQAGLTDSEYQSASARREFFREDAATLALPELADRVRAAVVTNDWPSLYLWTRLVPERITQASATNAMTDAGKAAFPADPGQVAQVRQALTEAERKLASKPRPTAKPSTFDAELAAAQRAAVRVGQIIRDRPGVPDVGSTTDGREMVPWTKT